MFIFLQITNKQLKRYFNQLRINKEYFKIAIIINRIIIWFNIDYKYFIGFNY